MVPVHVRLVVNTKVRTLYSWVDESPEMLICYDIYDLIHMLTYMLSMLHVCLGVFGMPQCIAKNNELCELMRDLLNLGAYIPIVQDILVQVSSNKQAQRGITSNMMNVEKYVYLL